jgi:mannitol-specific phosphotransferase system IIBC component
MERKTLYDRQGQVIGAITIDTNESIIYDKTGTFLGRFIDGPDGGCTITHTGERFGSGNLLTMLLRP